MNIAVIGAGGWGTALSILLHDNAHRVTLWTFENEVANNITAFRENKNYLPGVTIPLDIKVTTSLSEALLQSKMIVLSVPVQFLRSVLERFEINEYSKKIICNTSKGVEIKTLLLPSQIILQCLRKISLSNIVTLSGPSHSEEVARNLPTSVISASNSISKSKIIKKIFNNSFFFVDTSEDILGVELGAALKNIIAIGVGLCDGLGYGDNTKSGLLIKSLNEISQLGVKMGASKDTFYGLAGLGDLLVTCYSHHSRNHYIGEELGKGRSLKEITANMKMIAEGVFTAKSAYSLFKKYKIRTIVFREIYSILYEHKNPEKAIHDLMSK